MERIPQMPDFLKQEGVEGKKRVRIAWKMKETEATGHGEYIDKELAESHLESLIRENPDMEHWLEEEPDTDANTEGSPEITMLRMHNTDGLYRADR